MTQIAFRAPDELVRRITKYKKWRVDEQQKAAYRFLSKAKALNDIIENAITDEGAPSWKIKENTFERTPPNIRDERQRLRELENNHPFSFVATDEGLRKLDCFCSWLTKRNLLAIKVERTHALRTILAEALDGDGKALWEELPESKNKSEKLKG